MAPLLEPGELQEAAPLTYNRLARPVRSASQFYALYWLDEIRDETAASFDFSRLRNELYESFQVYGVFSVCRELATGFDQFRINGELLGELFDAERFGEIRTFGDQIASDGLDDLVAEILLDLATIKRVRARGHADLESIRNVLAAADEVWDVFAAPDRFLRAAEDVFGIDEEGGMRPTFGWHSGYGGAAWGAICQHVRRADDYPKTVWVNQSWAIQHNNAVWLNKLGVPLEERKLVTDIYNTLNPETPFLGTLENAGIYDPALRQLLDERKEGNMEPVFAYAWEFTEDLDVNLRRLSQRHGIGPRDVDAWAEPLTLSLADLHAEELVAALEFVRDAEPAGVEPDLSSSPEERREDLPGLLDLAREADAAPTGPRTALPDLTLSQARTLRALLQDALAMSDRPTDRARRISDAREILEDVIEDIDRFA